MAGWPCDFPGDTKPKFESDFQRDGILRFTKVASVHLTEEMADTGYADLGTWEYGYDAASNALTAGQTATMDEPGADSPSAVRRSRTKRKMN